MLPAYRHVRFAIPLIVDSFISRAMHIGFLSGIWPKINSTNVFLIRGEKKYSNSKLDTLVVGDVEFAHYFAKLVYRGNPRIQALMKKVRWSISSITTQVKADLVVVRACATLSKFLSEQDFIILPEINFTLDISSPSEQVFARMSKLRRRSIKAIKKLDYSYEITREPQKLDFFYYKMYLPYIKKRYG